MKTISRNHIVKGTLLLVSAVLLLLCLPKDSQNHYSYEVNRPWTYSLLTAPFDIPIRLDSASARLVKDSIDRTFEPVFVRDVTLEKTMIAEFATRLNGSAGTSLTPAQRNRLIEQMKTIYTNGIVSADVYASIREGVMPSVRFIRDNIAVSSPTTTFRSERVAFQELDSLFREPSYRQAITQARPDELLQPNLLLDSAETSRLLEDQYARAMAPIGVIQQGERIIDKGDIVTPMLANVLQTYEQIADQRSAGTVSANYYPVAGQALFVVIAMMVLFCYLLIFRKNYFDDNKVIAFLLLLMVGFVFFAAMMSSLNLGIYMVPFTIVPIMVVIFLDSRTAMLTHLTIVMIVAAMASFPLEFIFMQFVAGSVAIDSIKDLSKRSQLLRTAALVFVSYALVYLAIDVMQNGTVERLVPRMFGNLAINAVLVSMGYILLFIFEKIFGFTSRVTLVELSDINAPLLRRLSEECPGTFQHSMAVSTLAAAAASRIGANVQLVRAGALYHDIGKMRNPAFYTENQHGINPHDTLDPVTSAGIVVGHVNEGLKIAEKGKLPTVIRDFIREHHGKGTARYFYTTYCNAHPDEEVDPSRFSYPGPNPRSRETSILMMADAVEAASRSLKDHTPEAISALVNRIIDAQVAEGLHNDSPLSFADIRDIKDSFIKRLRTLYHSRISYPDKKTNA